MLCAPPPSGGPSALRTLVATLPCALLSSTLLFGGGCSIETLPGGPGPAAAAAIVPLCAAFAREPDAAARGAASSAARLTFECCTAPAAELTSAPAAVPAAVCASIPAALLWPAVFTSVPAAFPAAVSAPVAAALLWPAGALAAAVAATLPPRRRARAKRLRWRCGAAGKPVAVAAGGVCAGARPGLRSVTSCRMLLMGGSGKGFPVPDPVSGVGCLPTSGTEALPASLEAAPEASR